MTFPLISDILFSFYYQFLPTESLCLVRIQCTGIGVCTGNPKLLNSCLILQLLLLVACDITGRGGYLLNGLWQLILADLSRYSKCHMEEIIRKQQSELATLIAQNISVDGMQATAISSLFLLRASEPTVPVHALHEPALCIVAQGRKQVILADELYFYGPSHCLVVSVDLPVVGQVIEATPKAPYLCLRLDLDPGQLSALMMEANISATAKLKSGPGLSISAVGPELLDAAIRLLRLLETPKDIAILAPLIIREILYRLLMSEQSARLRQIALADNHIQSINRAINWLKRNYTEPFHIEKIAREASMSTSALHHHFKTITAMSPLQYQKLLRLQEARRLMLGQAMDAATASFNVGYESPSQFSREYSRLFGAPPSRDIARLKESNRIFLEE
jgi:AraC-like DNA-binding protein